MTTQLTLPVRCVTVNPGRKPGAQQPPKAVRRSIAR